MIRVMVKEGDNDLELPGRGLVQKVSKLGNFCRLHLICAKVYIGNKNPHRIQAQAADQVQIFSGLGRFIVGPRGRPGEALG